MKAGSVKRLKIPDSLDGIRFTAGRMVKMIHDGYKSPIMIAMARKIAAVVVGVSNAS